MNYFNDLAQTGMDGKDCLKLFWPFSAQTIHRIDHNLPKWTRMLHDAQFTCCFAVAIDECLVAPGDVRITSCNSKQLEGGEMVRRPTMELLSTTINLHENPAVGLPLAKGGILKLNSGRLSIFGNHQEGFARWMYFWLPDILDKVTELRLSPRTHTELLDPDRSTGLCVDVCIADRGSRVARPTVQTQFLPYCIVDPIRLTFPITKNRDVDL
jgi:hypothetical protein